MYGTDNSHGEGGGVYNQGTFTINGGTISKNEVVKGYGSGGGVYNSGTFIMNNGAISGNKTDWQGGGVFNISTFIMNGGAISDNEVTGNGGGGIYTTGKFAKDDKLDADGNKQGGFVMNGGVVSGNIANGAEGGGIHIADGGNAEINRGVIVNNTTNTKNNLGGGGIYVHGGSTLTMRNVIVTQNQAAVMGGGLAACATGRYYIYATDGAAIYGNQNRIDSNGNQMKAMEALQAFLDRKSDGLGEIDGYNVWKDLSADQKEKFLEAAMDIFIAGHGAGTIDIGMLMLGASIKDQEKSGSTSPTSRAASW